MKWWAALLIHNWVAHPLLPVAEVLDLSSSRKSKLLAELLFKIHDRSFPDDEVLPESPPR